MEFLHPTCKLVVPAHFLDYTSVSFFFRDEPVLAFSRKTSDTQDTSEIEIPKIFHGRRCETATKCRRLLAIYKNLNLPFQSLLRSPNNDFLKKLNWQLSMVHHIPANYLQIRSNE